MYPHHSSTGRCARCVSIHLAVMGAMAALLPAGRAAYATSLDGTVTFLPIDSNAYGVNDLNSVGISRDNLATVGSYQYTAYYDWVSDSTADIYVGRRALNSTTWTTVETPYSINTTTNGSDSIIGNAIDDHDVVAMAVGGNGDMHLSWGMHNIPLNYAISNVVNGSTFNPSFTTQTSSNDPNLFSEFTSSGIYQATYPEFYYTPNAANTGLSGNLLFDIRNAGAASGGGSGNGNTFFSAYNTSTGYGAPVEVLNGSQTSVNGYQNNLLYDHSGNLLYTWTWRESPNYQSNSNILFAQSSTNGQSWTQQGGSTAYTLPIIASTADGGSASQVAQVVQAISQNSSLINTTGMTVDANNNPIVATWWTPNGTSPSTGNPNRQYMLVYYTGSGWKTSQITSRTTDASFDTSGNDVRDLGRPLVMVDPQGRVLVVTRSDNSMGGFTNSSGSGNNIVVYWNTIASLDSASPNAWQPINLDTANMGEWEPSMDYNLWNSSSILDLFYEPSGFTGQTTGTAQVLQWNEQAYFAVATPGALIWDASPTSGIQDGSGTWDQTQTNWSDGTTNYAWNNNFGVSATFGVNNGTAGLVTLGSNITVQNITFNASSGGNYNIAGGGYTLSLSSGATLTANANATISAPLVVTGNLTKLGAGTLTLSGANTFSGTILLGSSKLSGGNTNGALRITTAAAVSGVTQVTFTEGTAAYDIFQIDGTSGNITLPSSLAFYMPGSGTIANSNIIESIAGNNAINGIITPGVDGNQYTVQSDAGTLTVNSAFSLGSLTSARYLNITGAGNGNWMGVLGNGSGVLGVTKAGAGTWTLSNTETYTGLTNISAGTVTVASGGSLAGSTITVAAGAQLNALGSLASNTTLTANGTTTFGPNSGMGILARTLSTLAIGSAGNAVLTVSPNHANRTELIVGSLQFAGNTSGWQGRLDLGNNDLIVHNGSLANLTSQVQQGYAGGGWNGSGGIISSAAAADTTYLTAVGVIQNSQTGAPGGTVLYSSFDTNSSANSDVLLKYTYYGDANLDGKVDGSDYARIDSGFLSPATGWFNGDFNYDGVVNGSDYALIDNVFNSQNAPLADLIASPTSQLVSIEPGTSSVPEPGASCMAVVAAGLLSRRAGKRQSIMNIV